MTEERFRSWTVTIVIELTPGDRAETEDEAVDAALYCIRNGGFYDMEVKPA